MKKEISKQAFLAESEQIFKRSNYRFIAVVFNEDGESIKWFNNFASLSEAKFMAKANGRNAWTHDQINGLQPAD